MRLRVHFIFSFVFLFLNFFSHLAVADDFFDGVPKELEEEHLVLKVDFDEEGKAARVRFRVWFQYAPDKVYKVLSDTMSFGPELSNFKTSRTLSKQVYKAIIDAKPSDAEGVLRIIGKNRFESDYNRQKDQNWTDYIFFEFNFPWPLADRWSVKKYRFDETNHNKGEYKADYKMYLGNFKKLEGGWRLRPAPGKPGWTEFYGDYYSDAGLSVPKFLVKKGVKTGFKKDMDDYRRLLSKSN